MLSNWQHFWCKLGKYSPHTRSIYPNPKKWRQLSFETSLLFCSRAHHESKFKCEAWNEADKLVEPGDRVSYRNPAYVRLFVNYPPTVTVQAIRTGPIQEGSKVKATYAFHILEKFEHTCYIQKDDEGCISFSTLTSNMSSKYHSCVCCHTNKNAFHCLLFKTRCCVVISFNSTQKLQIQKKVNWGKFVYTHCCVKARSEKFCFGVCLTKLHDPNCF